MKFTLSWLKEYIDFDISVAELTDRLTMLGLEVDDVVVLHEDLGAIKVGRVLNVIPHPNADRLTVCEVDTGGEVRQVVCGAPNVKSGLRVAVALAGTRLPSKMDVKEASIRGVTSKGMLCSEKELGISDDHAGIMELPDSSEIGKPLVEALDLKDTLIEVDLTPNRPDCASVIGIAREVAGFINGKLNLPINESLPVLDGIDLPFAVEIKAPVDCPRYAARLLRNVKIGPSPWWLKKRLLAVGLRPINNIVDITNFVMMEFGQPLHAFDYQQLSGAKVVVRRAEAGEKFTTLDSVERELDSDTLLICDGKKPVAIAGIMGGENSEVTDRTTDILLESAYFNPVSIRRTARQLNLATDSSYRFERGVDPAGVPKAMERAVRLMVEIAGADLLPGGIDCRVTKEMAPPAIQLRVDRTNALLGMKLSAEKIVSMLNGIEIQVEIKDRNILIVHPPTFRVDLEREVDLVEEVARLVGFNEIPSVLPLIPMSLPARDEGRELCRRLAGTMTALGYYEAVNYSFVTQKHFDQMRLPADDPARNAVQLLNPLTEDQNIMRTMLLPGLLDNLKWNVNRQNNDIRLFEIGKTFHPVSGTSDPEASQPAEKTCLTAVLRGRRYPNSPMLHYGTEPIDVYDVKGTVEVLLQELRLQEIDFEVATEKDKHMPQYIAADSLIRISSGDLEIGKFGEIRSEVLKSFGIKQDVFFFELNLDHILQLAPARKSFRQLPRFPAVKRDMAILVSDQVPVGNILQAIKTSNEPLLEEAEIFDIYRGESIKTGFKSVAISLSYRSDKKTLDDKTVDKIHQKLFSIIESNFNAKLREAGEK